MSELQKPSLYVSRARHLSACLFYVSSGAIIAAATVTANSWRLSQQNPYKTCVSLVELGRTSRHFIPVHLIKNLNKNHPQVWALCRNKGAGPAWLPLFVCGSGGVRDVHVIICTRVVQIGVAYVSGTGTICISHSRSCCRHIDVPNNTLH